MIKVIIADDHKIFRDGIQSILKEEDQIDMIAEAENEEQLLLLLKETSADIILMDIAMGESNGIDTTKKIKMLYPQIKVLALSMHAEPSYVIKMLEVGANGYLLKEAGKEELIRAIKTVAKGDAYYSNKVSQTLIQRLQNKQQVQKKGIPLTKRELEILKLIAEEYSNPEIAERLYISIRTVDTHRRNLIEKLGVKNTVGLVRYAIKNGLVE